jgi:EAL domain-containing protein (putative c-di-GMP-specific phosphodiesterase class I)
VRWQHPERGLLAPGAFLPLAEQSGLTRALTAFVLDRALQDMRAVAHEGQPLAVAVNLGPADLLDLGCPRSRDGARPPRLPSHRLVLESQKIT